MSGIWPDETTGPKYVYICPEHGLLPRSATHLAFGEVGSDALACTYCGGEAGQLVESVPVLPVALLQQAVEELERRERDADFQSIRGDAGRFWSGASVANQEAADLLRNLLTESAPEQVGEVG